jgi:hypothetical protein
MADSPVTTNSKENDAEKLARLLELDLMQKRTAWKQAAAHYRTIRLFGFLFLFILLLACAAGFCFVFSRVNDERTSQRDATSPAGQP